MDSRDQQFFLLFSEGNLVLSQIVDTIAGLNSSQKEVL